MLEQKYQWYMLMRGSDPLFKIQNDTSIFQHQYIVQVFFLMYRQLLELEKWVYPRGYLLFMHNHFYHLNFKSFPL